MEDNVLLLSFRISSTVEFKADKNKLAGAK